MSSPGGLPPRPGPTAQRPPGQWVGEGDNRRDIANLSDRGVAIAALDAVLRLHTLMARFTDEFHQFKVDYDRDKTSLLRDLGDHDRRIVALEIGGAMRPEAPSSHEWNEILSLAGRRLSERVKDQRDPMNSDRAKALAREVFDRAKVDDDARAFQTWKSRGGKIAWTIVKGLALLGVGAVGHWLAAGGR